MVRKLNAVAPIPFEIWREDGVMRVVFCRFTCIGVDEMKEVIRMLGAVDDSGADPVVLELEEHVRVSADARVFLARCSSEAGRPVAFVAGDRSDREMGELFHRYLQPAFPFRTFGHVADAGDWAACWLRAPRMRVVHAC
ncbi:MAG: hypothetical protein ABI599_13990 [Flavobacteriales bacterium]